MQNTDKNLADLVLSSMGEGVLVLDPEGNHTFVNQAAAKMLGYEVQELIGLNGHSTWHHTKTDGKPCNPEVGCRIGSSCKIGVAYRVSTEVFWRKDGLGFPVEYSTTPIYEGDRLVGTVVVFANITERKKKEEELRNLLQQAKLLQELLPICASCKKIRDDGGQWTQVETYLKKHVGLNFSHGVCPECMKKLYPEFADELEEPDKNP